MNYRVVEKEGFRIIGVSQPLHKELEQNFMTVPKMWQQAAADGTIGRLAAMMNGQPMGLLGVSACNDEEEWRYYIAVASSMPAGQGLEEYLSLIHIYWMNCPGRSCRWKSKRRRLKKRRTV